jgi:hypothetical protein
MVVAMQDFGKKYGILEAILPRVSKGKKMRRSGVFIGKFSWKKGNEIMRFFGDLNPVSHDVRVQISS